MNSIKACQIGAIAATPFIITSPPKIARSEVSRLKIQLPNGKIVTVEQATNAQFRQFVKHIIEQLEQVVRDCRAAGTISLNHGYKELSDARAVLKERMSSMDARWYILNELSECIGGPNSRFAKVRLFVSESEMEAQS